MSEDSGEKNFPSSNQNHTHQQESEENLKNRKSKSRSPKSPTFFERDKFFQDFYERTKQRPKLSERIFKGGYPQSSSIFENDKFSEDLRKDIEEKRKMFFDSDPFGGADFPSHNNRGGSPGRAGSGSPRMGRAGAGFPFEGARTRLDDFPGARHPMFSTMRRPAWEEDPFGGHPFNRERHNSGSSGGGASGSSTASTGEEHIIPIRIEKSDGTTTTNVHAKAAAKATASAQNSNPISTTPIPMPAPQGMDITPSSTPETRPQPKMQHTPGPQRSSTEVRKSPSLAPEERSPRAQSAPPDSVNEDAAAANKKFVSSINIEPQPAPPSHSGHGSVPHTQLGGNCTKEKTPPRNIGEAAGRPIPIFVEGRGPVINNSQRNGSPHPPQSHNNTTQQQPQQQPQQQTPKASRPAEPREVTPPPKKQASPKDPLEKVSDITTDVKELEAKVDEFLGNSGKDKEYLYLDEMLTRELIKLDVIETEGREDVRQARKDCIKLIQSCIAKLESKALSKVSAESHAMEIYQDPGAAGDKASSQVVTPTPSEVTPNSPVNAAPNGT